MTRPTTALPVPPDLSLAMSYEEWLDWAGESTQSEWVDGKVIVFMPPTVLHARVSRFLFLLLGMYLEARDLGEVLHAPLEMRIIAGRSSREPDLLFVAREHRDRITDKRVEGPADLVIELVSDDSVTRDRIEKHREYEAAGVPEYWLLDPRPRRQRADFYQLAAAGTFRSVSPDLDGRYHSAVVPGFWIRPDWLWQDPLPDPLVCLAQIAPQAMRDALNAGRSAASTDENETEPNPNPA